MGLMHTVTARFNSSFFFGLTVIGVLAGLNVLSSFFIEQHFQTNLSKVQVNSLYSNSRYRWDEANLSFDLEANLTDVYNWNVKLIFAYIEVEYYKPEKHSVVVWDKIIWRDQYKPVELNLRKEKAKYVMRTKSYDLRNTTATAKLEWIVVPITGFTYRMSSEPFQFTFPAKYSI
mmetsp:Transcript_9165/g.13638  ORF Transcript_9165/g.13638 Transcript_9165/m.13638 type:complete len:174 (+) Transcript_9165:829-1350(+)